jgi:hypothetical protein
VKYQFKKRKMFRGKVFRIVLTLGALTSCVIIFSWDKTSLENYRNTVLNDGSAFYASLEKNDSQATDINDVFISVKTSMAFHKTRLKLLLDTWISTCKNQVSGYI